MNFQWTKGISQKNIFKPNICILITTLGIHKSSDHRKTHFMVTEGKLEKHIKGQDLEISRHYWYTQVIWPGKYILCGLKKYKRAF